MVKYHYSYSFECYNNADFIPDDARQIILELHDDDDDDDDDDKYDGTVM